MTVLKNRFLLHLFVCIALLPSYCLPLRAENQQTSAATPHVAVKGRTTPVSNGKVLFIVPWLTVGGMDRAFIDMIKNLPLSPSQYDICILSRGHPFEKLLRKDAHIVSLRQARKKKYKTVASYAQWINQKKWIPTIKAKYRVQWVHTDLIAGGFTQIFKNSRLRNKIHSFVCVSNQATNSFRKIYPREANKACTILNIVDDEAIIKKSKEPQKEILPGPMLNVVTVCRVSAEKGLDRAIRIHKRLESEGFHFRWYVVGGDAGGGTLAKLQQSVHECALEKNFLFLGARMNPYPYIKAADIFVLPSYYEGWGLVITEAKILGCPVLSTDVAGAREQLKQDVTGIIVDSNDEAIYQGLKRLLSDPLLRQRLRENLSTYKNDNSATYNSILTVLHMTGLATLNNSSYRKRTK